MLSSDEKNPTKIEADDRIFQNRFHSKYTSMTESLDYRKLNGKIQNCIQSFKLPYI